MKRKKHAIETRDKILRVTRGLLQEHGYQKTTTRMIIQCCDIQNSTLYHFFNNKEDILKHIALTIIEKVRELIDKQFSPNPTLAFFNELSWYFFSLIENTRHAELYLVAFRSYPVSQVIYSSMLERLRLLKANGNDQELEIIISMTLGFLQSIGDKYINQENFDPHQSLLDLFRLLMRGLELPPADIEQILANIALKEIEEVVPNYPILSVI